MQTNNTGKKSETNSKHLTDTIEHYSDSMKNDYDRSEINIELSEVFRVFTGEYSSFPEDCRIRQMTMKSLILNKKTTLKKHRL